MPRPFVCIARDPWTKQKAHRATEPDTIHPDAVKTETITLQGEVFDAYKCPHCGSTYFKPLKIQIPNQE